MSEGPPPIGNPEAAAKRGVILQVEGGRMLVQYYDGTKRWEPAPQQLQAPTASTDRRLKSSRVRFDHRSELQFARLLDFYEIEWEYEPRAFHLIADAEGGAPEDFAPDFYLPAFDLYIEVTTVNQESVTTKNRAVRRLVEQYPSVRCKIIHQSDYLNLLTKYGLQEVVEPVDDAGDDVSDASDAVAASRADFKALITAA